MAISTSNGLTGATITQRQIAEHLGVSRQLVSFALRGTGRMSDEKRAMIVRFARENNYHEHSNHEARQMISRRYGKRIETGIVAAVFRATFEGRPLSSLPFFAPFFEGLEHEAIEQRLDLVLCPLRDGELPLLVRERRVDGVICLSTTPSEMTRIRALQMPMVSLPYQAALVPSITFEDSEGTRAATRHLIELGHRRIGYVGVEHLPGQIGQNRLAGYRQALREAEIDANARWIVNTPQSPTRATGAQAARALLRDWATLAPAERVTALVCYNDEIAMGAVEALQSAGIGVPDAISVTGFDDISLQSGFAPALTSIALPREAMGRRAIELLCQQNAAERSGNGDEPTDFSSFQQPFPVSLVTRASSAPPNIA